MFNEEQLEWFLKLGLLNTWKDLTTLELRRKRGDLIQIYKIFHKIEDIKINIGSVTQNKYLTRSHNFKIERDLFVNCPMRNNSLPNRSATTWNMARFFYC